MTATVGEVLRGASYFPRGIGFLLLRPGLWPLLVAPIVVTALLFVAGFIGLWELVGWLVPSPPGAEGWVAAAWWLVELGLRLWAAVLLAVGLYFASNLVATPFNDWLSQKVEVARLGPRAEESTWATVIGDLAQSLTHSVLSLGLWVLVLFGSLALNLFPVFGGLASLVVDATATALFLSREAIDGCLSRRRYSFGHKLRIIRAEWRLFLGFGLVGSAFVWIPFVNLLVLPLSIAGGTLLFADLERDGRVSP